MNMIINVNNVQNRLQIKHLWRKHVKIAYTPDHVHRSSPRLEEVSCIFNYWHVAQNALPDHLEDIRSQSDCVW